jgi:CO dehydrogenase/acetyl-CoA synthase beta subunit
MSVPVTAIVNGEFSNPEEGTTATVDRLVMAASYWKVSDSALRSLVHLTALACASDKVVSMTLPTADLDELVRRGLIRCGADRPDTVVLI